MSTADDDARAPMVYDDPVFLVVLRQMRARWVDDLTRWADKTPFSQRGWFRLSELIEEYAKGTTNDSPTRERASELLRGAVQRHEFDNQRGRSGVACLTDSPLLDNFRLQTAMVRSTDWKRLLDICWLRRDDCLRWLGGEGLNPPQKWAQADRKRLIRSGVPGRPTSRSLVEQELRRRIQELSPGEFLGTTIVDVCRRLSDWLKLRYPEAERMTPKTIQNALASLIRPHTGSSRK